MIQIVNKEECCGCEACANICPHGCIQMTSDEKGFLSADRHGAMYRLPSV